MASIVEHSELKPQTPGAPAPAGAVWGNSAPLALAAFAVTTFMLSMVNTGVVNAGVTPAVFGVAFMFGGLTQLIAGIIQFRTGNTFGGVLFSTFGAFWLSLFAIAQYFLKTIPATQTGHALGLFLYAFGIFTVWIWVASFRTNAVVVVALAALAVTFFLLGAGNYGASTGLVHAGGWLGVAVAALAAYLSCAELCEASYKRTVLPVFPLAKH
ncbi:MAG TPA: acetate uptake transporter [Streptosporangiaceae bacterium]|nr:acetate uptake transporter [Streptosporangiaceae bacterium]